MRFLKVQPEGLSWKTRPIDKPLRISKIPNGLALIKQDDDESWLAYPKLSSKVKEKYRTLRHICTKTDPNAKPLPSHHQWSKSRSLSPPEKKKKYEEVEETKTLSKQNSLPTIQVEQPSQLGVDYSVSEILSFID